MLLLTNLDSIKKQLGGSSFAQRVGLGERLDKQGIDGSRDAGSCTTVGLLTESRSPTNQIETTPTMQAATVAAMPIT